MKNKYHKIKTKDVGLSIDWSTFAGEPGGWWGPLCAAVKRNPRSAGISTRLLLMVNPVPRMKSVKHIMLTFFERLWTIIVGEKAVSRWCRILALERRHRPAGVWHQVPRYYWVTRCQLTKIWIAQKMLLDFNLEWNCDLSGRVRMEECDDSREQQLVEVGQWGRLG